MKWSAWMPQCRRNPDFIRLMLFDQLHNWIPIPTLALSTAMSRHMHLHQPVLAHHRHTFLDVALNVSQLDSRQ